MAPYTLVVKGLPGGRGVAGHEFLRFLLHILHSISPQGQVGRGWLATGGASVVGRGWLAHGRASVVGRGWLAHGRAGQGRAAIWSGKQNHLVIKL